MVALIQAYARVFPPRLLREALVLTGRMDGIHYI